MGIDPHRFYTLRRSDFQLMRRGFGDKLKYERELLKTVCASIAAASTGQYPVREALRIWGEETELSVEEFRREKARVKLIHQQMQKNDRGSSRVERITGDSGDREV